MLWYKAWLETRFRFFVGVGLIAATCAFFVFGNSFILGTWQEYRLNNPQRTELPWIVRATDDYPYFLWHFIFRTLLQQLWVFLAVLIGFGGLLKERAQGSAGFTLSLPVSRRRLFSVRAGLGLIEITILGLIPAILLPLLSVFIEKNYPVYQGISHSLLMILAGIVFYSFGTLISTIIQGEQTPALIGIASIVAFYFVLGPYNDDGIAKPLWIELIDASTVMAGEPDLQSFFSFPWLGLAASLAIAAALFYLALKIMEERDF